MKIIDFDRHFYEYAAKWVAAHPGLTEQQIDESYNVMMREWVSRSADWLDGAAPEHYFDAVTDPAELIDLICGYADQNINLPEPLYARIVSMGEQCDKQLAAIAADDTKKEVLRAEALGMLRDMNSRAADDALIRMVVTCEETGELADMAADILSDRAREVADALLSAYPDAPAIAQNMILDICVNAPGDERIFTYLVQKLRNDPEQRAMNAALLEKLGDERAIEPLKQMLSLFDLTYFDYLALRDAVESLGGDAGEERTFYGDPDYEALRNLQE